MESLGVKRFVAWWDLACEDFLAVEKEDFNPKLSAALKAEGVTVVEVEAISRLEAIRKAFPNGRLKTQTIVGAVPGGRSGQRPS